MSSVHQGVAPRLNEAIKKRSLKVLILTDSLPLPQTISLSLRRSKIGAARTKENNSYQNKQNQQRGSHEVQQLLNKLSIYSMVQSRLLI
jgi:hypothetical protein